MPDFYIAPEASTRYEIISPDGARAVLNDPYDPDFCGYLDGEDAISGIEGPEIRDSFADLASQDGAIGGAVYASRRPVVFNGRIIPSSVADRNTKLGKLQAATQAWRKDGILSWTPAGGEPVFLKFRTQLPFRAKGGFNKTFQVGLVANDPRIYTQRTYTVLAEGAATNDFYNSGPSKRFTFASAGTTVATRQLYLPPGTWRVVVPMRCSLARTVTLALSNSTGTTTPTALDANTWTEVAQTKVTANPVGTATTLTVTISSALTSSHTLDVGQVRLENADGLTIPLTAPVSANWVANAAFTATALMTAADIPTIHSIYNPGTAVAPAVVRVAGVLTTNQPADVYTTGAGAERTLGASSDGWLLPSTTAVVAIDFGSRAAYNPTGGASAYGRFSESSWRWGGVSPTDRRLILSPPLLGNSNPGSARAELTYRGAWL